MKSSTKTLIEVMEILSVEIQSDDGVANAAILEASERLREQYERIAELEKDIAFLQSCVNSGETAKLSDRPSEQAKQLKEQGHESTSN